MRAQKNFKSCLEKASFVGKNLLERSGAWLSNNLEVCPLKLYRHDAHCLFDIGSVPSPISTRLVRKLDLAITSTKKTIKVADETKETGHGVAKNIPVIFGEMKVKMKFLVVDEVSFCVFIGIPKMEKLSAYIHLGGQ